MVATPIASPALYVPISIRKIDWLPTVANIAAPTRAEINAGTDLSPAIPDDGVKGWTTKAEFADAPNFLGGLTPKVSKNQLTADDSSLDFYMSSASTDVRTLLTRGLAGYILMMWEGDVAGRKMTPFQVSVASQAPQPDGGNPARITIQFAILAFSEMVTIPA
jgi:hypothetical protein